MTLDQFLAAIAIAHPGDRVVYHTGFLANDRIANRTVHAIADAAWFIGAPKNFKLGGSTGRLDFSGLGAGALHQRRSVMTDHLGRDRYDYLIYVRRHLSETDIAMAKRVAHSAMRDFDRENRVQIAA